MSTLTNAIRYTANSALASPDIRDLRIETFGGEVLTRYAEYLGITAMVRKRSILSGDTATFPRMGGIGSRRHAVNTQLLGLDAESTELSITLDQRPLVSDFVIDDIDEMLSHFETRSVWSRETGQALAEAQDNLTLRLLLNASRATPTSLYGGANSSFPGGGIDGTGAALDIDFLPGNAVGRPDQDEVGLFLSALDQIQERFDFMRVPFTDRNVLVSVPTWHAIRQFGSPRSATDLDNGMSPLFLASDGTYGASANQQQFPSQAPDFQVSISYNGFNIWRSNIAAHASGGVFGQDLTDDDEAKYNGDFTNTRGVAFQADGVAVLEKLAITTETDRQVAYRNWLFVSAMLTGGGTLRPECVVEISDDA